MNEVDMSECERAVAALLKIQMLLRDNYWNLDLLFDVAEVLPEFGFFTDGDEES